jgi:hypothetical protein
MIAIRGVYDGKTFRALENEEIPIINGEVPVALVFLHETKEVLKAQRETAARNLRALRDRMEPLGCSVKDLIADSRMDAAIEDMRALREEIGPVNVNIKDLIEDGRYR